MSKSKKETTDEEHQEETQEERVAGYWGRFTTTAFPVNNDVRFMEWLLNFEKVQHEFYVTNDGIPLHTLSVVAKEIDERSIPFMMKNGTEMSAHQFGNGLRAFLDMDTTILATCIEPGWDGSWNVSLMHISNETIRTNRSCVEKPGHNGWELAFWEPNLHGLGEVFDDPRS